MINAKSAVKAWPCLHLPLLKWHQRPTYYISTLPPETSFISPHLSASLPFIPRSLFHRRPAHWCHRYNLPISRWIQKKLLSDYRSPETSLKRAYRCLVFPVFVRSVADKTNLYSHKMSSRGMSFFPQWLQSTQCHLMRGLKPQCTHFRVQFSDRDKPNCGRTAAPNHWILPENEKLCPTTVFSSWIR